LGKGAWTIILICVRQVRGGKKKKQKKGPVRARNSMELNRKKKKVRRKNKRVILPKAAVKGGGERPLAEGQTWTEKGGKLKR